MRYILNLPNYKGSFSFMKDGKHYSLPQDPKEEFSDEDWAEIKDSPEIKELQEAKLLHVLSESEPKRTASAKTSQPSESKAIDK